jgi:cobalt-precorrin 5A hydrolase
MQPASTKALWVGLGCRQGCPASELLTLLAQGLHGNGLQAGDLAGLASLDNKRGEPGLLALARHLSLPLVFFSAQQVLRFAPQLSQRSARAYAETGCHGVAESCALALATENGPARLVVTRLQSARATLALAGNL